MECMSKKTVYVIYRESDDSVIDIMTNEDEAAEYADSIEVSGTLVYVTPYVTDSYAFFA